jgi:hypothetical protein
VGGVLGSHHINLFNAWRQRKRRQERGGPGRGGGGRQST